MDKLKIIKALTAIMGLFIIIGVIALVYGISLKKSKNTVKAVISEKIPEQTIPDIWLNEPEGSTVSAIIECGGQLCLHIKNGGQPERIVVISNENGAILRRINVQKKPQ